MIRGRASHAVADEVAELRRDLLAQIRVIQASADQQITAACARADQYARERDEALRRPRRDWIQIFVTVLPSIIALSALIFTYQSVNATRGQLQITEQAQITDRYNAAITNLGSPSVDVRLGGIYALQRIMQDSPRDQPTIVAVLCAFVRDHDAVRSARPSATPQTSSAPSQPRTDIQAAVTVVDHRNATHDGDKTVVDFTGADLSGISLNDVGLTGVNFTGANLTGADLSDSNLSSANLSNADLSNASLAGANLDDAQLLRTNLSSAELVSADLTDVDFADGNLAHANLSSTNLTSANLWGVNLTHADFYNADLSGADLTHTKLTGANFFGAVLTGAKGVPAGISLSSGG